jgi:hypothetical protein
MYVPTPAALYRSRSRYILVTDRSERHLQMHALRSERERGERQRREQSRAAYCDNQGTKASRQQRKSE